MTVIAICFTAPIAAMLEVTLHIAATINNLIDHYRED